MRVENIISSVISASLIASGLLGFNGHSKVPKQRSTQAEDLIQIDMPTLPAEPPEVQKAEDLPPEDEAEPVAYAPPSLIDIPTITPDATFVQEIAPPPPPGIEQAKGLVVIPPAGPGGFGGNRDHIFDLSQLDQRPVVRLQYHPLFPAEMRRLGISGEVNVSFIVDADGNVRDPQVISASNREFEVAALQAITRWKFRSGRRNGHNVSTRMTADLAFELE